MPTFEFTSPQGKRYTVEGPEGATKEQAFQILQAQLSSSSQQNGDLSSQIPGNEHSLDGSRNVGKPDSSSLMDKAIGTGEAALNLITGATTGAIGGLGGLAGELAGRMVHGHPKVSDAQNRAELEDAFINGMQKMTYEPRTASGQQQADAVGQVMENVLPLMPMTGELAALGKAASTAGKAVRETAKITAAAQDAADAAAVAAKGPGLRDLVRSPADAPEAPVVAQIRKLSPAIADRVQRTLDRNPAPEAATPGTMGSVGSAGTDIATQRRALAGGMPVPIELTKGQATRDPAQLKFEVETAKMPDQGAPLRQRYVEQNDAILRNFDAWADMTGAEAPNLRVVGEAVDKALLEKAKRDKAEIRVAYKNAEKAGELAAPVSLDSVIDYLNTSAPDAETAPLLKAARGHAISLGIAEDRGGVLVPLKDKPAPFSSLMNEPGAAPGVTLKTAEDFRKAINRATDYEPTNIRQATILKGLIDQATENAGGDLYRQARRLRELYARQYEDRAVIAKLLNTKKGMADRQVALEDVFSHSILKGSLDDVRHVRRVLQTGGEPGKQAWRELHGATINWIKGEATKSVATDATGNRVVSPAGLDKAIRTLDHGGTGRSKLEFIFGKKGAQQLRDINDLAKVAKTVPPEAGVNTSNTAATLLAAFGDIVISGTTGTPVPIATATRLALKHIKDVKLRRRISDALDDMQRKQAPGKKNPPNVAPGNETIH